MAKPPRQGSALLERTGGFNLFQLLVVDTDLGNLLVVLEAGAQRRHPAEDERLVKVPLDGVLGRVDGRARTGEEVDNVVNETKRLRPNKHTNPQRKVSGRSFGHRFSSAALLSINQPSICLALPAFRRATIPVPFLQEAFQRGGESQQQRAGSPRSKKGGIERIDSPARSSGRTRGVRG